MLQRSRSFQVTFGGGIVALAFAFGRASVVEAPGGAAPARETAAPEGLAGADREPSEVAQLVSAAIQDVCARCEASVVQVRALGKSRRGGLRRLQDGSGVVLRRDGVVVTNEHVVRNADAMQVILHDGSVHAAEILGRDPRTDLAVLRVEGLAVEAMPFAEHEPAVGELVLAMGNPLGFGHTVTLGVVNGVGRSNLDIAQYENYIQTDAAINPGNSGGPLVDLEGRALGINVAMGLQSNGDSGLAFAIPAYIVRKVVDDIVRDGSVRHASFGVRPHNSWQWSRIAAGDIEKGYTGRSQVKVRSVEPGSPAETAGIAAGDIILSVGARRLTDEQSLRNVVLEATPGDAVDVTVWRSGKEIVLAVTFGLEAT